VSHTYSITYSDTLTAQVKLKSVLKTHDVIKR